MGAVLFNLMAMAATSPFRPRIMANQISDTLDSPHPGVGEELVWSSHFGISSLEMRGGLEDRLG